MSTEALALLSLLPILSVAVFLVVLRMPAARAMPIAYVTASLLALFGLASFLVTVFGINCERATYCW